MFRTFSEHLGMKLPATFPFRVKSGNSVVTIYRHQNAGYDEFKIAFYVSGKRKFETYADYEKAKRRADEINGSVSDGNLETLTLSKEEIIIYKRAEEVLAPLKLPVDVAAIQFAEALKLLGQTPLLDAIRDYLKNHKGIQKRRVREVVDEYISIKKTPPNPNRKPASAVYLKDLNSRLGKFADAFPQFPISDITPDMIEQFLAGLKLSGRTWFNYARLVRTLFLYAQAKGYYPEGRNPMGKIEIDHDSEDEIEIFTPEELEKLFAAARPEIIPFLAIGAFAGLRHAEITRLDWTDIKEDHIEVTKGKAKTRSRRLIPISANLQAWLTPYRRNTGPVAEFANMSKQLLALANNANLEWRHNALRHSFISYRMAMTKDENQTATEAGNSPAMIYQSYRQLVTERDACHWFSIKPLYPVNVKPMEAA